MLEDMSDIQHSFKFFSGNSTASSRREQPRHRAHGLLCNLGDITDLSSVGMRVRCRRAPQQTGDVDVVLTDYTRQGDIIADVVWMKPSGNFHFEVGLKFRKLSRALSSRVASIALSHRFRRAI